MFIINCPFSITNKLYIYIKNAQSKICIQNQICVPSQMARLNRAYFSYICVWVVDMHFYNSLVCLDKNKNLKKKEEKAIFTYI